MAEASSSKLTKRQIAQLPIPQSGYKIWWDTTVTGLGLKVMPTGRKSWLVMFRDGTKQHKKQLGVYPALTPEIARQRAIEHQQYVLSGQAAVDRNKPSTTLGDVLQDYIATLKARNKADVRNVENGIRKHIERRWPALWSMPAIEVTPEDCLKIVKAPIAEGKLRTADFMRSYLHAAFEQATRTDPNSVTSGPVLSMANPAKMKKVEGAIKPKKRFLTESELNALWRRVSDLPYPKREMVSLWILTGCQRQQQLARAQGKDIHEVMVGKRTVKGLELIDTKGRTGEPRQHFVPLTKASEKIVKPLLEMGDYLLTLDGKNPIGPNWFNRQLKPVVDAMAEAGELEGEPFTAGALRSTVETLLGKYGVSRENRGHLQSHGNSGVQAKHYDRHNYAEQKLEALEIWEGLLNG